MNTKTHNGWHALPAAQVLENLGSSNEGLQAEQVESSRKKHGENKLPEPQLDSMWRIFFRQFQSPLIYILLAAALIILSIHEYTDTLVILFVLIFNAVIGALQEGRAQSTLASLNKLVETKAVVIRNGIEDIISDQDVVVGDILILKEGDKVPADARIIRSETLTVDESPLTGESIPVHKISEKIDDLNIATADMKNMVFKGTNVVAGAGMAVVVAIGVSTIIGAISKKISTIQTEDPLKQDVRKLSRLIIIVVAVLVSLLFVIGLLYGKPLREMFLTTVSMAVSLIPEGLPIVLTLVLATGVWRMSKRNALVKKLQAVESLGQATVIALDKTGTITQNEMVVEQFYVDGKHYFVDGVGYLPKGEIRFDNQVVSMETDHGLKVFMDVIAGCATAGAKFNEEKKIWQVSGDPTEAAMTILAEKAGIDFRDYTHKNPKIDEMIFSYQTKFHAALKKTGRGLEIDVIGAPETLISLSSHYLEGQEIKKITNEQKQKIEEELEKLASNGLRVVAVAMKSTSKSDLAIEDIDSLTLLGFAGMKDALRPGVAQAIREARDSGMKIIMITGDHKSTAQAIAAEAGIFYSHERVLTGTEIDRMSESELEKAIENVSVFARVSPDHKLKIIRAYRAKGEIIAMTGDGVNDAPPLVAADLGIAMGKIGTEVAKEAADIVLLDDNFNSIIAAIEEGRSIYRTIKKVILYLFSTSLGEILVIAGSLFLNLPLPIVASQIIWLNFITDGFLVVALAMEPKDTGLMHKKTLRNDGFFLDQISVERMFVMAIPMMIGSLWLFTNYYQVDYVKASTITLTAMAVYQWFNAWNCRYEKRSAFTWKIFENKYLIIATMTVFALQVLAVYTPFMQKFLKTKPLTLTEWLYIVAFSLTIILAEEIRKFIQRKSATA